MSAMRQQLRSLGALLLERGLLTRSQLDAGLAEQKRTGEKLGRILVSRGWVREKDIVFVLQGMMVVVFNLRGQDYGLETLLVREIIRHMPPLALPSAPDWLQGVISYRGQVVPLVDLGRRLGQAQAEVGEASRIIIYEEAAGRTWGLHVDHVSAVAQVGRDQLETPEQAGWTPPDLPLRWLAGMARLEQRVMALLAIDEILKSGSQAAETALAAAGTVTA
jgi:purine-binding chemotaxis protein CheW